MDIRYATLADLDAVAAVEAECFPAAEAATKAEFAERIQAYGSHFWLLFESGTLIAFVDGFVTNEPDLTDEMYAQLPCTTARSLADDLWGQHPACLPWARIRQLPAPPRPSPMPGAQGRRGLVLTCKPELLAFYAALGFQDEGVTSKSTHGNVVWHQMRLTF